MVQLCTDCELRPSFAMEDGGQNMVMLEQIIELRPEGPQQVSSQQYAPSGRLFGNPTMPDYRKDIFVLRVVRRAITFESQAVRVCVLTSKNVTRHRSSSLVHLADLVDPAQLRGSCRGELAEASTSNIPSTP